MRSAELKGIEIPEELVPLAIDEFPALLIAAACADSETVLSGAEELRVKESDRIASMAEGLTRLGIVNEVMPDGIRVQGGQMTGGEIDTYHDHQIAMSFPIAALRADGDIIVNDCDHVATSFPNFASCLRVWASNHGSRLNNDVSARYLRRRPQRAGKVVSRGGWLIVWVFIYWTAERCTRWSDS